MVADQSRFRWGKPTGDPAGQARPRSGTAQHGSVRRMSTEPVVCNQCGAPLDIPSSARFATCRHCGSSLAVNRSPSVVTTEVIERVADAVDKMAADVADLKRRSDLQEVDDAWESERKRFLIQTKNGVTEPSETAGIMTAVIGVLAGLFFAYTAFSMGFAIGALFGVAFIVFALFAGISNVNRARALEDARRRYQSRRAAAIRKLDEADDSHD